MLADANFALKLDLYNQKAMFLKGEAMFRLSAMQDAQQCQQTIAESVRTLERGNYLLTISS